MPYALHRLDKDTANTCTAYSCGRKRDSVSMGIQQAKAAMYTPGVCGLRSWLTNQTRAEHPLHPLQALHDMLLTLAQSPACEQQKRPATATALLMPVKALGSFCASPRLESKVVELLMSSHRRRTMA